MTLATEIRKHSGNRAADRAKWPSFSIVVPTYQRRDVVFEAVRALCRLEYDGKLEIIVVVDGSTDGTSEALATIKSPYEVTVVEQPNRGSSDARNRGAALARHMIILFLDDDMIVQPDLLREHAQLYRNGADAVIGDTPIDERSTAGFLADSVARWISSERVQNPLSPFDIFTGQLSVRRSVFEQLGGFDVALTAGPAFGNEDADFGARLLSRYDVRHNPAAVSRQIYVVEPREYMDRAARAVAADLQFIRKYPGLARELFDRKGIHRPLTKWVYLPLTRIPFAARLISKTAVRLADWALATRFRSNRVIARFFSGARSVAYWSELRAGGWLPFSDKLLVLCYHAIEDQSDDPVLASYGVSPAQFAKQLDSLVDRGFSFITPSQLDAFLRSQGPLPRRPVLLTFDDGYADLLGLARDLLLPRKIEALAFVVTDAASNEWDQAYGARPAALLSPEQWKEIASLGVEIGSHSRSHREMPLLSSKDREAEVLESSADLVAGGLPPPRFFAYPYGALDEGSKSSVRNAGFVAAFGLKQSWLSRVSDRFDLPRVIILSTDKGWRFWFKTALPAVYNLGPRGRRLLGAMLRTVRRG